MANYSGTPVATQIFNVFDRQGLLLGLPRLPLERNPAYKWRLFGVMARRGSSAYQGLINAISRELGLEILDTITISPVKVGDENILTNPAVVFSGTKCYLYLDYNTGELLSTIDIYDKDSPGYTIQGLADQINATEYYSAGLTGDVSGNARAMTIFEQSSLIDVPSEDISGRGSRIVLTNRRLMPGTVTIRSPNLKRAVDSETDLERDGDYTIDHENGTIVTQAQPAPGSFVKYQFRDDDFLAQSSPVILHDLRSADFQTKMFEQITNSDGETSNGIPTPLGADLINELMSVFPAGYGV